MKQKNYTREYINNRSIQNLLWKLVCVCELVAGGTLKPPNPPTRYRQVINQLGTCTCSPLRQRPSNWKKKCHIKFFPSKAKALVEEVERKLELPCKGSRGNIISKLWANKYWTVENFFNCLDLLVDDLSVFKRIINA